MPQIHPTAIVDSGAQLADDVIIGPDCVISSGVKVGTGCRLIHRVTLKGPLEIGANCTIYPNVCLGFSPQDLGYDHDIAGAGTVIGDGNVIREGVTVHRATQDQPTTIGDRNYLMANSHVGHDCRVGNDCILVNGALLAGHVTLQDRVIVAGNGVVHQFCRVGRLAMISGISGIGQDLPPFCVSYTPRSTGSLNIVGLRRAGYREHMGNLKKAYKLIYLSGLPAKAGAQKALDELGDDALCAEMANFILESKRGVVKYKPRQDED